MDYMKIWDLNTFYKVPSMYPTNLFPVDGFDSFFYEGALFQNRLTRVFAYYKAPEGISPKGGWPAVVLVHGGGGTAFPWMIKKWNEQGFAAISMDLEGHLPDQSLSHENRPIHDYSSPSRKNVFDDYELPITEQWMYHAVAEVIRANSLLQSFDEINSEKVGIFGISWGGIITSIVAAIDQRFNYATLVYGCGYLSESDGVLKPTKEQSILWEPMNFIKNIKIQIPMLFINGTNDKHFPLDIWEKTVKDISGNVWRCILPDFDHGHLPVFEFGEHFEFAKKMVADKEVHLSLDAPIIENGYMKMAIPNHIEIVRILYNFTRDSGIHEKRIWQMKEIGPCIDDMVKTQIIKGTTAMFINVIDRKGFCFSSEYIEIS